MWESFHGEARIGMNESEILKLAPDASSAKAAQGLTVLSKWSGLGRGDEAVWGACQGSGSNPYQVRVDMNGLAFKCSCPSRKFPCKHGLAMMLLLSRKPEGFPEGSPPEWVSDWLSDRRKRESKKVLEKSEEKDSPKDEEKSKKRELKRWERMSAGMNDLERWICDHARQGFANMPDDRAAWMNMVAAMTDAQLPAISSRLKRLWDEFGKDGWHEKAVRELCSIMLLAEGVRKLEVLPEALAAEIRISLGLVPERQEVLSNGRQVDDAWLVAGQVFEESDNLWMRKVWLVGKESGVKALLLDFSYGGRKFENHFVTGDVKGMKLSFFPGASLYRAIVNEDRGSERTEWKFGKGLVESLGEVSDRLAVNPWAVMHPVMIENVVPYVSSDSLFANCEGELLELKVDEEKGWRLLAASGGHPVTLFGEWDGRVLRPLNAWSKTGLEWNGDEI